MAFLRRTTATHSGDSLASDREIISRYTDQPETMPSTVRDAIESAWSSGPVQIYALADLDGALNLGQTWVAIGRQQVAVLEETGNGHSPKVRSFERADVTGVRDVPGLSCTTLHILGEENQPPLATVRYTHRQRRAMENVRYLLERGTEEVMDGDSEADRLYARAMAKGVLDAQASVVRHQFAVVGRLMTYLMPYKGRLIFGTLAAMALTAVSLVMPLLTKWLIDDIVVPFQAGELARDVALERAWWLVAALGASYLIREACLWVRLRSMSVLGEYVARDLRRHLYEHLQTLSLNFYSSKQTGSIITRVSSDTDRLWDFVAFGIIEVSLAIVMLTGLSGMLIYQDLQLGLIMVLPVPLLLWAFSVHGRIMKRLFMRAFRKWSTVTEVLSDTIPGMRVVKAFNQEDYETGRFNQRNSTATDDFNNVHTVWTKFWPGVLLGLHVMMMAMWIAAMPRLLHGPDSTGSPLSFGTFMAFLLFAGMFFQPIETIGMMTRMLNRATTSALRIFEILDTAPEIVDGPEPVQLTPVRGAVEFNKVCFAYDSVRPIIKDMSFKVEPGEIIGLVGPSGAGKTTVVNLLARFYEVTSGRILIDGVDLRELDTGHFRRQVGMVLQDPHLFHGSILDNIRYGMHEATMGEVITASRAANAHDFVCKLPHGYDTMVGERGHTLSGGERQRVSIARAVLCNPRILILDEATSSVDTETERKIQEALERLVEGRTVFAIAHRLSTLRRANRLIVIEEGRIAESGTHAELLANEDGTYTKLHRMQIELHEMYAV